MNDEVTSNVVVIIEDDDDIRALVEVILTQAGFEVVPTATGIDGIDAVRRKDPDVVVLDVGLPDIDGFAVVRRLREFSQAYVVMLTAHSDEVNVLQGLSAGADTYLTKPFRPRELRARIDALMRRPLRVPRRSGDTHESAPSAAAAQSESLPRVATPNTPRSFAHNGLHIDVDIRTTTVDGVDVALTRSEFDLLASLVEAGRRVRTKADLAIAMRARAGGGSDYVSDADRRTVEAHLGNLRRKLGDLPENCRFIETVRGVGYRLTEAQ
ncbi:response regulator transcription factor [Paramicrobacterium agarici]|uniref:response regulator transcription factor n=1 Tax=Paramicrobacterium agarici TaxID=630514 RepID=UPI00114D5515|nr:response regulator transcription factor [Microbacterium agarici]TQO23672.1 DNA-binding response OmpR family regulator [Microbacterium agarici]